jgi:hypothetical protein
MSMIVNLGWPIVSTNQHAEVREAITSPFEASCWGWLNMVMTGDLSQGSQDKPRHNFRYAGG